ncbi:MAG: acyl-CoA dehydrogenase [Deltaproteobacteria bacterium]|jgi:butyryl-CoA dehydrogenase|nr:acyl-CoA dehydrogenase [Deltaproteobacteria bacterium]
MKQAKFFNFTDEQLEFKYQVDRFVKKEIRPFAQQWDEEEICPLEIFEKLGELEYLKAGFPESVDGVGGMVDMLLLIEGLAAGSAGVALAVYVHMGLACATLESLGTEEQIEKYLKPGLQGKKIGCWAYAEPNAGADVTSVQLEAKEDGDHYILNGSKLYITNGSIADFAVVVARTSDEPGLKGISLFIVEKGQSGFTSNVMKKLGMRSSKLAELVFKDCKVPKNQMLGPLHLGFRSSIKVLSKGRAIASAFAVGIGMEALRQTVEHTKIRQQGGGPLAMQQSIRFTLANMETRLEAARLMAYSAAELIDKGKDFDLECSIAKLYATESTTWCCERALHLHGAQGYMMDSDIQRFYRDCKVLEIGEGTNEIQREMISGALLR